MELDNKKVKQTINSTFSSAYNNYNGKPKCYMCKKKLGLFHIKCKCNHIFCNQHRYSNEHNCTYDYFKENKNNLNKNNKDLDDIKEKIVKI